jgi:hypothetical protein
MKAQVDSCPPDESGSNVKKNSVTREPCGQKGSHHKGIERMGAWKTGVQDFSLTFGKLSDHFQKDQRSLAVDDKFHAISDCRLDGIKEKEMIEDLFSLRQKPNQ